MARTPNASHEAGVGMPTRPPCDDIFRAILPGVALRSAPNEGGRPIMFGHFAKFGEWAEIDSVYEGHFLERTAPGSFKKTLAENRANMRVLFHHGMDTTGVQVLGSIDELYEDDEGPYYEVSLFDGIPPLIMDGLRAGQYGSSYRFKVLHEDYVQRPPRSEHNPRGLPERTIIETKVREFGPTPFPAFAGATSGVRSLTDEFLIERLAQDPERFGQMMGRSGISLSGLETPERPAREYKRAIDLVGETVWAIHPSALATILAIIGERASGYRPTEDEIRDRIGTRDATAPPAESKVAVIPLYGPIIPRADMFSETSGLTSVESFQQAFRAALSDTNVSSILIDIDSPGGSAAMIPELASEIMAARGTKPIVAVANTMAASAAYWIASAADEIVVTPSGDVGSIGVYTAHTDLSKAQEKAGIKTTLISAGEYKVERNPFMPLSEEAQTEMQQRVDAIHAMFMQAVADGRGVTTDTVMNDFGKGRVVIAPMAVELGMADRVATFAETLAELERLAAADAAEPDETPNDVEPEPSAATTRHESEPPVATTRARARKSAGIFPTRKEPHGFPR